MTIGSGRVQEKFMLCSQNPDSAQGFSKDDRKAIHEFLRLRYQGKLGSETSEKGIEVSYCGVNSKGRKRKRWFKDCPNHCYFTLAKENKDTISHDWCAIVVLRNNISLSSVTTNTFRTHGIKDRRAVTCQRVSCNRIEKERILSLNPRLRDILVYDFSYDDKELKMGGHWGNRFSIILRHDFFYIFRDALSIPPANQDILEQRLKELGQDGFINYFGTQRFGSCDTNTATVGKHILRRDWEAAIRLILSNEHLPGKELWLPFSHFLVISIYVVCFVYYSLASSIQYKYSYEVKLFWYTFRDRLGYLGTVGDAVRCWEKTGDASQALKKLKGSQAFASIEAIIFKCLSKGGTWQKVCLVLV
ncbi:unnamed protein product [Strongylus vulgaris]|uniref:TRUD domain-containing protein n=1 Tax=Strongylus vulgaris TaxID=40348 RepID=A0A3P7IRS7_STRVU|nr:unnamed protein product [Strongylus vulgaris]